MHIPERKAAILLIYLWHRGKDKAFAWRLGFGHKRWGFVWLIVNRDFINSHCDAASSLERATTLFIWDKEVSHTQPRLSYRITVVPYTGLHHSPVISFPFPCCVAAQRMRTKTRVGILAMVSPGRDEPFLLLRLQGSPAQLASLSGFWIKGNRAVFVLLLQVGDSC